MDLVMQSWYQEMSKLKAKFESLQRSQRFALHETTICLWKCKLLKKNWLLNIIYNDVRIVGIEFEFCQAAIIIQLKSTIWPYQGVLSLDMRKNIEYKY